MVVNKRFKKYKRNSNTYSQKRIENKINKRSTYMFGFGCGQNMGGCNNNCNSGCGFNSCWIILLLLLLCNCGCGADPCFIIVILLILCNCGNKGCDNNCGC